MRVSRRSSGPITSSRLGFEFMTAQCLFRPSYYFKKSKSSNCPLSQPRQGRPCICASTSRILAGIKQSLQCLRYAMTCRTRLVQNGHAHVSYSPRAPYGTHSLCLPRLSPSPSSAHTRHSLSPRTQQIRPTPCLLQQPMHRALFTPHRALWPHSEPIWLSH